MCDRRCRIARAFRIVLCARVFFTTLGVNVRTCWSSYLPVYSNGPYIYVQAVDYSIEYIVLEYGRGVDMVTSIKCGCGAESLAGFLLCGCGVEDTPR